MEQITHLSLPGHIRVFTGRDVDPINPTLEMIDIEDIAHGLSMQCRFGGHTPRFYSVAQHCVLAARSIATEYKFDMLMHDASEAYIGDIPRPIKHKLANYNEIEDNLMKIIAKKYNFTWPMPDLVKKIDDTMLIWEWENIMKSSNADIECWAPRTAKDRFLRMFDELKPKI